MEIVALEIAGVWLARSTVHSDNRGSFREWFKSSEIKEITGIDFTVAQANLSESKRGVVRGIHYSLAEVGQAKWITCISGAVMDVVVDIRPTSPTFGRHTSIDLVGGDGQVVLIEAGLGHAFISQFTPSIVSYLVSSQFSPSEEYEVNPFDPAIGIDWGIPKSDMYLSTKDLEAPTLEELLAQGKLPK